MKRVKIISTLVICVFLVALVAVLSWHSPGAASSSGKIEAVLVDTLTKQNQSDYIVHFVEQADLSLAYGMGWQERGVFVVNSLTETALRNQAKAKEILSARGMRYQTFIAGNELYVWGGNLDSANALADLPEVEYLRATRTYAIDPLWQDSSQENASVWAGELLSRHSVCSTGDASQAQAWGIAFTRADQFWSQFGVQGDGIVVANIDTGVQWNHPALDQAFKCGSDPTNTACWYDPSNICGGSACDNNGHGTHTMGTMVGDDDPTLSYQVGMAPNARWIACKGCEGDQCSDYALNSCADWILQPAGDPANRPNVVNNSWGGDGGSNWYLSKVSAWRAAGIFPAFSAGNSGPGCSSLGSPGDYQESFASAAVDSGRSIANFSSRGPSAYGYDPYTKPNIAAPGVGICSSVPGNGWDCSYSGTSMASPHSAGAAALLMSCNPGLVGQVDAVFQALQDSAASAPAGLCGAPPDGQGNYTYGYGYLDIYQAGVNNCGNIAKGFLNGYVRDAKSGAPISGVTITASPAAIALDQVDASTDPTGYYTTSLPVGSYDVTASKYGYQPQTINGIVISESVVVRQDFTLEWTGVWRAGPNDPTDFTRYDCVWFDDGNGNLPYNQKVYCMGGRNSSSTELPDIWRFDPLTGVFTDTGDDMVEGLSNYTANLIQDEGGWAIYVIGGYDVDTTSTVNYVQRYEPAGGSIALISSDPCPVTIGGVIAQPGGCAPVQNKIYCFGGWESSTAPYFTDQTWEYDPGKPAGSRWQQIETANLSEARGYIQIAVQNDIIYTMGGISGYESNDLIPTTTVEALDVSQLSAGWKVLAPLPVATAEGRGFGFDADTRYGVQQPPSGKLYVVGGGDWPAESSQVMEYAVLSDTWNPSFPELLSSHRDHAGVYIPLCTADSNDGMPGMWVFGGRQSSDDPPYLEPEYFSFPCEASPPPVTLQVTAGTDPHSCSSADHLEILTDTQVTYCYTMANTGQLTYTLHDLSDNTWGVILDNYDYMLSPGESFYVTRAFTVTATTFNLGSWTAYTNLGATYLSTSIAVVYFPDSYFVVNLPTIYK